MIDYSSEYCNDCPYKEQVHLLNTPYYCERNKPLSMEKGDNADILIVLQAPGEEEWNRGTPLLPIIKKGGTAGRRVELSWQRKNKNRKQFDITNTVQCFPGKGDDNRDLEPVKEAIEKCYEWLKQDIYNGHKKYKKIIVFGEIANEQVQKALNDLGIKIPIKYLKHPNGGLLNTELDKTWE